MATVNVGTLIDEGRWSGYQKLLIAGTALTIILDGVDNQLLPNALPRLIEEWQMPRTAFNPALSAGPFGMMIGGVAGGMLGDRYGRRTALLWSVMTFALLTLAVAFARSIDTLAVLRFLAGVGLGGAMPNAATLASEYVPRRQRPFAVTLTIVCIPLGGMLAARLAGEIIPRYGWRPLFMAGGVVPVVLAVLLWKILPESPRYLAGRRERWGELTALLRRMGHRVGRDASYQESAAPPQESRAPIADIFTPSYRRDTVMLCAAFFFCLMVNYIAILLIPAAFRESGFEQAHANRVLENFNLGGVVGAIAGALLIQRLGSRITMLGMTAVSVAVSLALVQTPLVAPASMTLMNLMVLDGALLNGVQTTMYALAAHVFPTAIRGTGVGTAVAFGRIGNVLAPYVGNYALDRGRTPWYFSSWALAMALVFVALAAVGRHISRSSAAPPAKR